MERRFRTRWALSALVHRRQNRTIVGHDKSLVWQDRRLTSPTLPP